MVRVAACSAGRGHLRPIFLSIPISMVQFYHLTSRILMCVGGHNSPVQELLELRLDCSPDLATSSNVGSDLPTLADLQSGHPSSNSLEHQIELLSVVKTSRALKPLSALFPFSHPVIRGLMARSQATERESELLYMFSSFYCFHLIVIELITSPNGALSVLKGTFVVFRFA